MFQLFLSLSSNRGGRGIKRVVRRCETGLPWWLGGKESTRRCRRHRSDPRSGETPHSVEQLSPPAPTTEPVTSSSGCATTEPTRCNYWKPRAPEPVFTRGAAAVRSSHIATRESPRDHEDPALRCSQPQPWVNTGGYNSVSTTGSARRALNHRRRSEAAEGSCKQLKWDRCRVPLTTHCPQASKAHRLDALSQFYNCPRTITEFMVTDDTETTSNISRTR